MKQISSHIIYENPLPQLRAVNSAFPFLCQLKDGRILAAHQMGQAFESVDGTTFLSESTDGGVTWSKPWQAHDKSGETVPLNDNGKVIQLADGRLVMLGYQFFRENPDLPLGNPETGGLLPDEIYFCISEDDGRTWSARQSVDCAWGQQMAVVGEGNINFDRVFEKAAAGGTQYMMVEQDNCNGEDPIECLRRSYNFLKANGFE